MRAGADGRWRATLFILATSVVVNLVLLSRGNFPCCHLSDLGKEYPVPPRSKCRCLDSSTNASTDAAAGASGSQPAAPWSPPPTAMAPATGRPRGLGVVLAQHVENTRWVQEAQAELNGELAGRHRSQRPTVSMAIYYTPGEQVWHEPTPEQLAEAEAAMARRAAAGDAPLAAPAGRDPPVTLSWVATPINRGHEALAYVSAIVESYHSLPDLVLFLHAHRYSPHSHLIPEWVLRRFVRSPPDLPQGYLATQCLQPQKDWCVYYLNDANATGPGFRRWHLPNILQAWDEFFEDWLGPPPDELLAPPNAEFVATREAIHSRPLEFWVAAQRWLILTDLEPYVAGMVFEYLWQLVLTGEPDSWPPQAECMCGLYGLC